MWKWFLSKRTGRSARVRLVNKKQLLFLFLGIFFAKTSSLIMTNQKDEMEIFAPSSSFFVLFIQNGPILNDRSLRDDRYQLDVHRLPQNLASVIVKSFPNTCKTCGSCSILLTTRLKALTMISLWSKAKVSFPEE